MISALARAALFVCGLAVVVLLVRSAGTSLVLETLARAGPWLPLLAALELSIVMTDYASSRFLVADVDHAPHALAWARAAALAYASATFLPAGRAAGEAVRAATLAPIVGAARATRGCAQLQVTALVGNAIVSLACAVVVVLSKVSGLLVLGLLGNALVCAAMGGAMGVALENPRFASWLAKRFRRFAAGQLDELAVQSRAPLVRAVAFSSAGRGLQTLQYGVALVAVGGKLSVVGCFVAQGIHLVGASLGDFIPNQMGATEGAYGALRGALKLGDHPERAVSIALLMRMTQLGLAAVLLAVASKKLDQRGAR